MRLQRIRPIARLRARADRAQLARDQVRCCSPTQLLKWKLRVCLGRVSCYYLRGWGCSREKTFAEADIICQAAGARLCTKKEIEDDCTQGSGCAIDGKLIQAQKN